jgi:formylglycine-generating enzyme required for sulfatase activity
VFILLLGAALIGLIWWQLFVRQPAAMVEIAAGTYVVRDPTTPDATRPVTLAGYLIDEYETTNAAYRRCQAAGACPALDVTASARQARYLLDPAFDGYPVVHVPWEAAAAFCAWAGKRLPSAEEWEVAAGYVAATNRWRRYPWGDQYDVQRANSAASGIGDTVMAGAYRPAGDSPSGAADMAGNVAEWTSTWVSNGGTGYVVKGGSYASDDAGLAVTAQTVFAPETAQADVGFRCARTLLLGQQ